MLPQYFHKLQKLALLCVARILQSFIIRNYDIYLGDLEVIY